MRRQVSRTRTGLVGMTVVLTLVGACSRPAPAPPLPPTSAPLATPVSAPALAGRGQVVDAQRATVPGTGDAQVVVYRSTNGTDGAPTQVSGVFVTPTGLRRRAAGR
ncbi:hypothetical protein [Tsukamurella soli]|uniref:hypothetical protein n=1 Tax=Tsukamurella soli TaxID=644556 RepID=UPI003623A5E2